MIPVRHRQHDPNEPSEEKQDVPKSRTHTADRERTPFLVIRGGAAVAASIGPWQLFLKIAVMCVPKMRPGSVSRQQSLPFFGEKRSFPS